MLRLLLAALLFTVAAGPRPHADDRIPSVKDVMRRVGAYVAAYGEKASIVVATETYTQDVRTPAGRTTRRLVADFAIVKVETLEGWQGFRDVLEVDGARVSDRQGRLVRLLIDSDGRYDEARRLSDESARFNIGAIHRNFNVPTAALFFFGAGNHDRFKFSAKGVDGAGIWEIAFRETSRPTLIRTPKGESLPCEGSVWVNPADGTVVRTLLKVAGFATRETRGATGTGRVDVTYGRVADLGMWLPESMAEEFEATRAGESEIISGHARYTNYRQFTTMGRIK
jgi:hypothetical protein